ncbi:dimethylaniline monooxygenase [Colletotrichum tofieldiae]|uniref:Flavin-containing monooxygenase 1 n=1 Tax=Colletotrichum tofieldiae TaxID=708197 RepID=A0A166SPZ4_9PEZI|nr:dimethylaniline monooxygenase [Colletotrichum tofieldiae]GKT59947.1 dimethylaniline monooxygenase [Colletotrichum tofieldiae]GKT67667.1 dimethylaniline monooxygenase [Colletotrichum tofieldiae]
MASQSKRVAIIGAGPSGLVAIKECLAAGLTVQCFERAHALGGQWLYEAAPTAGTHSSMYAGVILNSSRSTTGFSDFPIDPARYPIYYSHELQLRYLNEYAAHFDLEKHVRFNTSVVGCAPRKDGGWEVRIGNGRTGADRGDEVLVFDAVVCGTGLANKPIIPDYEGRDRFKGEVLHSQFYRTPSAYEGKKVVVVGLGSSAVDIACEVGPQAKQLTIVSRRGGWVLPRFILGKPLEAWDSRAGQTWIPASVQEYLFEKVFRHAVGKMPAELQPDHGIINQNVTVRSDFMEKLQTGVFALRRSTVASFTETGVILADGTTIDADAVILATGYHIIDQPYLPPGALASRDAPAPHVDLYKMIVPPRWKGLYVLGQAEQNGPVNPVSEAQARYIAAVIGGRIQLPGEEDMMRDVRAFRIWQQKHFINSDRHALSVEFVRYVDGLLEPLGAAPSFWKLFGRVFTSGSPLRALKVLSAVFFGISAPAQWRLVGEGSTTKLAEETLLRTDADAGELSEGEKALI